MRGLTTHLCAFVIGLAAASLPVASPAATPGILDQLYADLADPDNPEWQIAQADILREWSKSGSPAMDLLLKRGEEALEAGDLTAAVEHLTALTDLAPTFAEGWHSRAIAYFRSGEVGPALADIRQALEINPHHFGALNGLGIIFEDLGMDARAMAAYRASLAIHPHQEDIQQALDRLVIKTTGTAL